MDAVALACFGAGLVLPMSEYLTTWGRNDVDGMCEVKLQGLRRRRLRMPIKAVKMRRNEMEDQRRRPPPSPGDSCGVHWNGSTRLLQRRQEKWHERLVASVVF